MVTGGVTFNGTSDFLEHTASSIVTAYPYSISLWVASPLTLGAQEYLAGLGSSTQDAIAGAVFESQNTNKIAYDRSVATGTVPGTKSTSPNFGSTLQLMVVRFTSSTSREVAFGNNTFSGDTSTSISQNFSHFDRISIGAARRNNGALQTLLHSNATIAEVHFFNAALTSSDFTTLLTTKPDGGGIASWVDGWPLDSASSLTSIGGTRTLTATGSPTTASLTLPYTRAAAPTATLSGSLDTITGNLVAGAAAITADLNGALNSITGNLAAGGSTGRLTSQLPLRDAARITLANRSDLAVAVLAKPGLGAVSVLGAQSISSGIWTNAGPYTPGTRYNVLYEVAGEPIGCEIITATPP